MVARSKLLHQRATAVWTGRCVFDARGAAGVLLDKRLHVRLRSRLRCFSGPTFRNGTNEQHDLSIRNPSLLLYVNTVSRVAQALAS